MKPHGTYKLRYRRCGDRADPFVESIERAGVEAEGVAHPFDGLLEDIATDEGRVQRLLESLREEILAGGGGLHLRIRQVFRTPREIFRLELELPDHSYQRTTFLDRDALEALLEADDVREIVETGHLGG